MLILCLHMNWNNRFWVFNQRCKASVDIIRSRAVIWVCACDDVIVCPLIDWTSAQEWREWFNLRLKLSSGRRCSLLVVGNYFFCTITRSRVWRQKPPSHCPGSADKTLKGVPVGPRPSRTGITAGQKSERSLKRREAGTEHRLLDVGEKRRWRGHGSKGSDLSSPFGWAGSFQCQQTFTRSLF